MADAPILDVPRDAISGATAPLRDAFGRRIDYLRLSVTDRCDLRCHYCMAEHPEFMPRKDLLSTDELLGIAAAFVARGIRRIRLTGGEPLTRRDILPIAQHLGTMLGHGLDEWTLTTNATQLAPVAADLAAAGLRRANISLDSRDAATFAKVTRGGDLTRVMAGIDAADDAGIAIRINMVAMAGINDAELPAMVDWCEARGFDLGLIESMPLGDVGSLRRDTHISLADFIAPLLAGGQVQALDHRTSGPARYVTLPGRAIRLGLITPLSNNFCAGCNRVRLSADGKVHGCLGHDDAIDLAAAWRSDGATALDPLLDRLMATKAERHRFAIGGGLAESGPTRHMNATGG